MSEVKKEWLVWKGQAFNKDNPAFEIISAYDTLRAQLAEAQAQYTDARYAYNDKKKIICTLRAQLKCAVDALKECAQLYDSNGVFDVTGVNSGFDCPWVAKLSREALAEIAKMEAK